LQRDLIAIASRNARPRRRPMKNRFEIDLQTFGDGGELLRTDLEPVNRQLGKSISSHLARRGSDMNMLVQSMS